MKNHNEMKALIQADLTEKDQAQACLDIIDSIFKDTPERRQHNYKFNQIYQRIKYRNSVDSTISALIYLSGSKTRFLRQSYQFIDDYGQLYDLEHSEVIEAVEDNEFYHPETGERVEEFDKKIFLVYLINNE